MLFLRKKVVENKSIQPATPPWQGCIAVCSKCARKLGGIDGEKTRLRVALKALIATRGLKKQVRAVDSSCFDFCPEGLITVAHFTPTGVQMLNVGATAEADSVLNELGYSRN